MYAGIKRTLKNLESRSNMLTQFTNDSEIVEQLLMEYTTQIDLFFNFKSRKRKLRCGFCTRRYKYQVVLNHHVASDHMADLKKLTDRQRKELIYSYIKDQSEISYHEFQNRYLRSFLDGIQAWRTRVGHFWYSNKKRQNMCDFNIESNIRQNFLMFHDLDHFCCQWKY